LAANENACLISITESHLKPHINDAEIHIENYESFRTDRANDRKKGGIINYVREDLLPNTSVVVSYSNEYTELQVLYFKTENLLFVTLYRPPNCPTNMFTDALTILKQHIDKFDSPAPNIIVMGDFNFPFINWETNKFSGGRESCHSQAKNLIDFSNYHCLNQCIQNNTRENSILDLLFTNNEDIIHKIEITCTTLSDHNLISIHSNIFGKKNNKADEKSNELSNDNDESFKSLNFFHKNTNWIGIKQELALTQWTNILSSKSPDEMYSIILEICLNICTKHVPRRRNKKKSIIPRDRKILMNKRSKLKRNLLISNDANKISVLNKKIENIEKALKVSYQTERKLQENLAVAAIKSNPKYFYAYAKRTSKLGTKIGPLLINDVVTSDPKSISEALNDQYKSVFSTPSQMHKIINPQEFFSTPQHQGPTFSSFTFDKQNILDSIKEIANNSASGPDKFPAILLKKCAEELCLPLHNLWTASMHEGEIPKQLKSAIITPIYKGGLRDQAKNYRPVALTSHIIKVFEKVIVKQLTKFLEENKYMNENQHGFRSKRSCLSQLLAHYETILAALESNKSADVIYLDFAKAFDKVDHGILMHKMRSFGITGEVAVWIHSFLTERKQQVAVDTVLSSESSVISGVPQGTVLGPLLFLILISDINQNVQYSTVSSFADDTRVIKEISSDEDSNRLQFDLKCIYQWASENNMSFNSCKFEKIHYRYGNETIYSYNYTADDGAIIAEKENLRDLGVTMSNTATFRTHINSVANSSRRKLGWILRTFETREPLPMITLWKSLIVPILDYCSQLWCPWSRKDIQLIESVQRTFTSRITSISHLNYWERLKILKLYSIERRRERYIIIYVWKMINNMVPNIGIQVKNHPRLGIQCLIRRISPRATNRIQTICSASLRVRGCQLFNILPKEIRNLQNIETNIFKDRLDTFLSTIPDEPKFSGYIGRAETNSLINQSNYVNPTPNTTEGRRRRQGAVPTGPVAPQEE